MKRRHKNTVFIVLNKNFWIYLDIKVDTWGAEIQKYIFLKKKHLVNDVCRFFYDDFRHSTLSPK